jgi:GNAT superfamily N-acetyltransferase
LEEEMVGDLTIRWCREPERAEEFAAFFAKNAGTAYISHSELQGPRASSPDKWSKDLKKVLIDELKPRLRRNQPKTPAPNSMPIAVAERKDRMVALSFVTFRGDARTPFGIIEDLIVDPSSRGHGIGTAMIDWIGAEAQRRKIKRLFLESGVHNERAHTCFHRAGFETCSHVMMKPL